MYASHCAMCFAPRRVEGCAGTAVRRNKLDPGESRALCSPREDDMRSVGRGNMLGATIAELQCVEIRKKVLAGTEQRWSNG